MPKQMARQASGTVSEARSAGLPCTTATTRHIVAAMVQTVKAKCLEREIARDLSLEANICHIQAVVKS